MTLAGWPGGGGSGAAVRDFPGENEDGAVVRGFPAAPLPGCPSLNQNGLTQVQSTVIYSVLRYVVIRADKTSRLVFFSFFSSFFFSFLVVSVKLRFVELSNLNMPADGRNSPKFL